MDRKRRRVVCHQRKGDASRKSTEMGSVEDEEHRSKITTLRDITVKNGMTRREVVITFTCNPERARL